MWLPSCRCVAGCALLPWASASWRQQHGPTLPSTPFLLHHGLSQPFSGQFVQYPLSTCLLSTHCPGSDQNRYSVLVKPEARGIRAADNKQETEKPHVTVAGVVGGPHLWWQVMKEPAVQCPADRASGRAVEPSWDS